MFAVFKIAFIRVLFLHLITLLVRIEKLLITYKQLQIYVVWSFFISEKKSSGSIFSSTSLIV